MMAIALVINRGRTRPIEQTAAFANVAEKFRRGGELKRAVQLCRDGLANFPEHVSARVTLGLALLDLGRLQDARIELRQALKLAPDNLAAIRGLAHLHEQGESDLREEMPDESEWMTPEAPAVAPAVAPHIAPPVAIYEPPPVEPAPAAMPLELPEPLEVFESLELSEPLQVRESAPRAGFELEDMLPDSLGFGLDDNLPAAAPLPQQNESLAGLEEFLSQVHRAQGRL